MNNVCSMCIDMRSPSLQLLVFCALILIEMSMYSPAFLVAFGASLSEHFIDSYGICRVFVFCGASALLAFICVRVVFRIAMSCVCAALHFMVMYVCWSVRHCDVCASRT